MAKEKRPTKEIATLLSEISRKARVKAEMVDKDDLKALQEAEYSLIISRAKAHASQTGKNELVCNPTEIVEKILTTQGFRFRTASIEVTKGQYRTVTTMTWPK